MADAASVTISATVLPDEISKILAGTMTVTPADSGDKWYYKLSRVGTGSSLLMNGSFIGRAGNSTTVIDDSAAMQATDAADKIKFLFVKNTDSTNPIYICISASTTAASASAAGNLYLPAGQSVAVQTSNTTLGNVAAISTGGNVDCIVAALLDDVA